MTSFSFLMSCDHPDGLCAHETYTMHSIHYLNRLKEAQS